MFSVDELALHRPQSSQRVKKCGDSLIQLTKLTFLIDFHWLYGWFKV